MSASAMMHSLRTLLGNNMIKKVKRFFREVTLGGLRSTTPCVDFYYDAIETIN